MYLCFFFLIEKSKLSSVATGIITMTHISYTIVSKTFVAWDILIRSEIFQKKANE